MNWTREQLMTIARATERKISAKGAADMQRELAGIEPPARSPISRMLEEHEAAMKAPAARTNRGNDGRSFQNEMETTAGGYQSRRVAMLRKVDPPVRVIWIDDKERPGKKRQHVIFRPNPFLDFVGTWTARGGRALFVEAKSTATHLLRFKRHGGLTEEQLVNLRTWSLAGAATAVVWQWAGKVVLFTPAMLAAAEGRGAKSLVFESGFPVPRGVGTIVWDFLAVLDAAPPAGNL